MDPLLRLPDRCHGSLLDGIHRASYTEQFPDLAGVDGLAELAHGISEQIVQAPRFDLGRYRGVARCSGHLARTLASAVCLPPGGSLPLRRR
ncbi:hypothetical protein [Amycolatopsis thermoflava]|uniref:hypothetical protein n=1 Tax=Amycolatopsis thermoflava TaxID=84480 RepID=UPI00365D8467